MSEKPKRKSSNILTLMPIIIFSSIVPLIVYVKYVYLSKFVSSHWMGQLVSADVFSYYKMILIIICGLIALILMIKKLINAEIKISRSVPFFIAILYGVLIILSILFSEYSSIALWGAPERYEGGIVLISYMILFIYAISILDNIKSIRIVFKFLIISSVIIFIISVMQFFGLDIFKINFIRSIINMNANKTNPYNLQLHVEQYASYATLYNPNNLSLYINLIFPITLAFYSLQTALNKKIAVIIIVFLCLLSLVGSNSSGGYYAVMASIVVLLFLAFPYIKRNIKSVILLTLTVSCLFIIVNFISGGRIAKNLTISSITNEADRLEIEGKNIYISDIILGEKEVFIDTTDSDLTIINKNNTIQVFDNTGKEIETILSFDETPDTFLRNIYTFDNEKYTNYTIKANKDYSVFTVFAGIRIMYFHMTDRGVMVPGLNNTLDTIRAVDRNAFLYERPQLFSGRGYIWSGLLPILKDTVLIGKGPDTTFLTYPQHDYIGKINMRGNFNVVIEKPHSYYLQIAHDTGWISLILLLVLFAYYTIDTLIVLIKFQPHGFQRKYSVAILCGVIAYLIASIMYDSSVLTAPVFWIVLAVGIALNRITRGKHSTPSKK